MRILLPILVSIALVVTSLDAECKSDLQGAIPVLQQNNTLSAPKNLSGVREFVNSFKQGSEPLEGINGINWRSDIKALKEMVQVKCNIDGDPDTCSYRKNGHIIFIEPYEPIIIRYNFWKGQFCYAGLMTQGENSWAVLKKYAFDEYGEAVPSSAQGEFIWKGDKVSAWLYYSKITQRSVFLIFSNEIMDERDQSINREKTSQVSPH